VAPVLLLWLLRYNRAGKRWTKAAAFAGGSVIALLPVFWLVGKAPRQAIFNIFEYHMLHRQEDWPGAIAHDLGVMTDWLSSSQALLLGLLAAAGLAFAAQRSGWDCRRRAEFYLCGWLSLALAVHISMAHPTFARYYLLTVPFLAILATVGLYSITTRMMTVDRPFWPVLGLTVLLAGGLAKSLPERTDNSFWQAFAQVAAKVDQVTPRQGTVLADEHVYFLTRRTPPSGMELADSHKLTLPAPLAAQLHVIPHAELEKQIRSGRFDTVVACDEEEYGKSIDLDSLYPKKSEFERCTVFWGRGTDRRAK
jgi:hypothetical protein